MTIHDYHDKTILPFSEIYRKVKEGENFTFARYGDGEFDCMLNPGVTEDDCNCDGHFYFPELSRSLEGCFMDAVMNRYKNYFTGLHMSRRNGEETKDWLLERGIESNTHKFAQNAVFHDATGKKRGTDIADFYKAIKERSVILVGPKHLKQQKAIKVRNFIECPAKNSYTATDEVLKAVNLFIQKDDVVLFCAGPPAPLWIHRLHLEYGDTCTLIDFGSTLDPEVGVLSRSFHKKVVA